VAARSKARKRAVDVLYESDVREVNPLWTLAERVKLADPPVNDYTSQLVTGVTEHRLRLDEILAQYADGWTIERMPGVDRAVLRIGLYELLWCPDVPVAVVIDEAVELVKSLSTDESPRFVNGVLARVLRDRDDLTLVRDVDAGEARDEQPIEHDAVKDAAVAPGVDAVE
jgi:N utilization substance protein B